jgi:hypothetical protein
MKYNLGDYCFKSKKDIATFFKKQIINNRSYTYERGSVSPKDCRFLYDLLKLHPDFEKKTRGGCVGFLIRQSHHHLTEHGVRHNCAWIIKDDGSLEDFSYKKCLYGDSNKHQYKCERQDTYEASLSDGVMDMLDQCGLEQYDLQRPPTKVTHFERLYEEGRDIFDEKNPYPCGVYFLWHSGQITYVGASKHIYDRLFSGNGHERRRDRDCYVSFIAMSKPMKEIWQRERCYISLIRPIDNRRDNPDHELPRRQNLDATARGAY